MDANELKRLFDKIEAIAACQMTYSPVIKEWNPELIIIFGTPNFSVDISETINIQEKRL